MEGGIALGTAVEKPQRRRLPSRAPALLIPIIAALTVAAAVAVIVLLLRAEMQATLQTTVQREAAAAARLITEPLSDYLRGNQTLATLWNEKGPRSPADWRRNVDLQLGRNPEYMGLVWLSAEGEGRLVVLREGRNAAHLQHRLSSSAVPRTPGTTGSEILNGADDEPLIAGYAFFEGVDGGVDLLANVYSISVLADRATSLLGLQDTEIRWLRPGSAPIRLTGVPGSGREEDGVTVKRTLMGRDFVLRVVPSERFLAAAGNLTRLWPIIVLGTILSALSALLAWSLSRALRDRTTLAAQNRELGRQRALTDSILRASPDALFFLSPDRRIQFVSEGFVDAFGYTHEEALGKATPDLYADREEFDKLREIVDHTTQKDQVCKLQARYVRRDGEEFPGSLSVGLVRGPQREIVGFLAAIRDMTEETELVEQIDRSRYLLARTSEIARVGGWSLDLETDELTWSNEAFRIYDLPVGAQPDVGAALKFFTPEARATLSAATVKCIEDGTPWDLELPIVTAEGRNVWVRAIGEAVLENGVRTRLQGVFQDLTELRKLRAQREHLFDAAEDLFAIIDPSGALIEVNDAWVRTLGWTGPELIADGLERRVYEEDRAAFTNLVAGGDGRATDIRLSRKDGETVWLSVSAVHSEPDDLEYLVARDVTARRQMEEDLRTRERELARSNKDLEQFAYIASHDLNEPLRKVRAFGDRLLTTQGERLDDKGRDYIARMQAGCVRMGDMITALLQFSRAGRSLETEDVDLQQLIDVVRDDLQVALQEAEATVEAEALPTVHGNRVQLGQLFQNLIGNATKFRNPERPPIVRISADRLPNDRWEIRISDNGIGFEAQYAERVFDLFQRLHTKGTYEGTGLGLAICRRIVEVHGGRIRAEACAGEGATFIFDLSGESADE